MTVFYSEADEQIDLITHISDSLNDGHSPMTTDPTSMYPGMNLFMPVYL